jgi:uncharacterized protein YjiS (DUF1127 family)
MTIHQAKGLEFDIVVLPELEADLAGQSDLVVLERPDVTGPVTRVCRYAHEAVRKLMPAPFQHMFDEAVDRDVTESLCVLYVALTRAIHALHIIVSPSAANERIVRRNLAGLLRVALKDAGRVEPDAVLYQHGDPAWFRRRPKGAQAQKAAAPLGPPATPIVARLAPVAGPRRRGLERARPSGLEGGSRLSLCHLFAERSGAFARGQLVHAWFEQVRWLDEGRPNRAVLRRVGEEVLRDAGATDVDIPAELAKFDAMLAAPTIAGLLRRERYRHLNQLGFSAPVIRELHAAEFLPSVQNERGFAIRQNGQLLTGFIDRLVLLCRDDALAAPVRRGAFVQRGLPLWRGSPDPAGSSACQASSSPDRPLAAEIIDFKTDALDPGNAAQLAERIAFYSPQLQAYRDAVSTFTGLSAERITVTLAFVQAGVVRSV